MATDAIVIPAEGFVVLPDAIGPETIATLREQLAPYLRGELMGRNDFEGFRSERVYSLLAKAPAVAELIEHRAVLEAHPGAGRLRPDRRHLRRLRGRTSSEQADRPLPCPRPERPARVRVGLGLPSEACRQKEWANRTVKWSACDAEDINP